ncbi:hypothetical protein NFI96_007791, partial [Prochilodus magdalenae]
ASQQTGAIPAPALHPALLSS